MIFKVTVVVLPSGVVVIFCIIVGLFVDFAIAQAAALTMGQPSRLMLLRLYSWL